MREMKDSGIEWVGAIPSSWKVLRNKYNFVLNKCIVGRACDDTQLLSLTKNGVKTITQGDQRGKVPTSFASYQIVDRNDLVMCLFDLDVSAVFSGVSPYDGMISPAYKCFKCKEHVLEKYVDYYFRTVFVDRKYKRYSKNVRYSIGTDEFMDLPIIIPPIEAQNAIANYLDGICSRVDDISVKIQTEIETLEGYKKSIIIEAVTKGINAHEEMKDSGVAWCPQIPRHWKVISSKYLFQDSDLRKQLGDVQLTASQKYGIITQQDYMERENAKIVLANHGIEKWKHVEPFDFVISLRSFQGGLEMSEISGCITWHYVVLKPRKPIVSRYYKWLFKSDAYIKALQQTCNFIRDGQDLRYSNFAQVPLFLVPLEEQQMIADYLDAKVNEIDTIIKEKQEMLAALAEYKKSMIYEYVTGKKEVPAVNDDVVILFDPNVLVMGYIANTLGDEQEGRIQAQKIKYLLDNYCGLNPNIQYYRFKHGPYDMKLNSYFDSLVDQQWFKQEQNGAITLAAGTKHADFLRTFREQLGETGAIIDDLLGLLQSMNVMKRSRLERIATLYAVWNDFLLDGITPTDDQIIQEVLSNWTENKKNFKYETWQGSLNKMKKHGLIPKGTGLHTLPKPEKDGGEAE